MLKNLTFIILSILLSNWSNARTAEQWVKSGNDKMEEGNMLGAIKDYSTAIEINPAFAEAYLGRGSVYGELLAYPEAIKDINNALLLKPTLPEAYFNRGFINYMTGDYNSAIKDFNKYLSLRPDD